MVNKDVVSEKISTTLTAQRTIQILDHISHVGGMSKIVIDNKLLASASSARKKHGLYLDEQKTAVFTASSKGR